MNDTRENKNNPGLAQIAQSVSAAAFGVQSSKNRERDFAGGKPWHYIVGGVLFTLLFIIGVWSMVQFMLSTVQS